MYAERIFWGNAETAVKGNSRGEGEHEYMRYATHVEPSCLVRVRVFDWFGGSPRSPTVLFKYN